jgi:hypothetical protein
MIRTEACSSIFQSFIAVVPHLPKRPILRSCHMAQGIQLSGWPGIGRLLSLRATKRSTGSVPSSKLSRPTAGRHLTARHIHVQATADDSRMTPKMMARNGRRVAEIGKNTGLASDCRGFTLRGDNVGCQSPLGGVSDSLL